MLKFFQDLFTQDFLPHGYCFMWKPEILWLHLIADSLIFLAYYSIPLALLVFIRKRKDLGKVKGVFHLFIFFILFCGTTHAFSIYTLWVPAYGIEGVLKLGTGVISVWTAIILWPVIPRALAIPSAQLLHDINQQLKKEIEEKNAAEKALREYQEVLEERVVQRTQDLELINEELRNQIAENEAAKAQINVQATLLDQVNNSVIILSEDLKITYWNNYTKVIFGLEPEAVIGKSMDELDLGLKEPFSHIQERLKEEGQWNGEIDRHQGETETLSIYSTVSPLRNTKEHNYAYAMVSFDLSERKKIENKLQKAMEEVKSAAQAKENFLSTMSHEIRTPLNAIIGLSEVLLLEDPKPYQKEYLDSLKFAGENLLYLINDILDFNKIQAHKINLEVKAFSPLKLLKQVRKLYQVVAENKGIELTLDYDSQIPAELYGDAMRLYQIISNLVSNALKFTTQGKVELKAAFIGQEEQGYRVLFGVRDTGIGISPEEQERIFEAFSQADSGTHRKFGGTGLGLAICQRLAELQGTRIEVESTLNEGSYFFFQVLFPIQDSQKRGLEGKEEFNLDSNELNYSAPILLVDDNPINLMVSGRFLINLGLEYETANNGQEALEKVEERIKTGKEAYSIILMDVYMPLMDGFESSRAIRALAEYEKTPIIALTASTLDQQRDKLKEAGMNDYLGKPFQLKDLLRILHQNKTS